MKKCNIISVLLLLFVIMLSACGQNVSENNVKETINNSNEKVDTTSDENSSLEEYAYEDGKYLVSETFTSIANYDDCIYKIMQYSSSTQESSIDDIDFLLQQIDKYKDRSERSLSELENYNYADIIECKETLSVYLEKVKEYSDKIINDLPTENDDKYTYDDYKENVYSYREFAKDDVLYIWDAY